MNDAPLTAAEERQLEELLLRSARANAFAAAGLLFDGRPKPKAWRGVAAEKAKRRLMKIGVKRVAAWCNVNEFAVYQWFARATDARPIPARHAVTILKRAAAEGEPIAPSLLLPGLPA